MKIFYNGEWSKSTDTLGNSITYKYDGNKREIEKTDSVGTVVKTSYDYLGNVSSLTDGNGNVTEYTYDYLNRLINVKKINNGIEENTKYTYDLNGNMLTQTTGKVVVSYEYNVGNKVSKKISSIETEIYKYNGDGTVETKTDKNGISTNYIYDIHGRVTEEKVGSITIKYTYDKNNNIKTIKDTYKTRWVVNAAGLYSDKVSKMLGIDDYTIHPCRGEYFILDEKVGSKLSLPAYPVPNPKEGGLGIHLTPTIDGNVFIGPSSEYIDERDDYSATQKIMDLLIKDGGRIFPHIRREDFIRNFAGIRPKLASKEEGGYHDFVIEMRDKSPNTINLVGIESPGLTSSTPIAKYVVSLLKQKEELTENENFNPIRKPIVTFNDKSVEEKEALIKENPDYGEVICRCQTITKAEILEAINNPLGVETLTGIKYRCRAMMGRCQGGYCETRIAGLLEEVKHKNREDVLYSREGSNMFVGKVRD